MVKKFSAAMNQSVMFLARMNVCACDAGGETAIILDKGKPIEGLAVIPATGHRGASMAAAHGEGGGAFLPPTPSPPQNHFFRQSQKQPLSMEARRTVFMTAPLRLQLKRSEASVD